MKLSREEILQVTFGAVNTAMQDGCMVFYKCTANQMAAWIKLQDWFEEIVKAPTGVRLDFHTNSNRVRFTLSGRRCEVLINGQLEKQFVPENVQTLCSYEVVLPEGENRFTLVFTSHGVQTKLKSIELDDGAYIRPHIFDRKILFIGDSITQGWDSRFDALSYAWQTSLALNAESVICGIGGSYFKPEFFEETAFEPDMVVIAYGTNDLTNHATFAELQANAAMFFEKTAKAYSGKKLVYVSPIYRFDRTESEICSFETLRTSLTRLAEAAGFHVVDGYSLVPHFREFYADEVHPNDLGFLMYAKGLTAALKKEFSLTGECI